MRRHSVTGQHAPATSSARSPGYGRLWNLHECVAYQLHMATNLFCPSCGTSNSTDQSFCRSCGLNLEKTADSLFEQMPASVDSKLSRRSEAIERFGDFAFTGFAIVVVIAVLGILYAIVTKMILSGSQPYSGTLLAAFIVFAGLALGYVFLRESMDDAERQDRAPPPRTGLDAAEDRIFLPEDRAFEPVPSVVESTTRRLKVTNDLSKKN